MSKTVTAIADGFYGGRRLRAGESFQVGDRDTAAWFDTPEALADKARNSVARPVKGKAAKPVKPAPAESAPVANPEPPPADLLSGDPAPDPLA